MKEAQMTHQKTQEQATHPVIQFKRDIDVMVTADLGMLDDRSKARMKNAAAVAVTKDPELLLADRASLMMAIRMCAQHGVTPDGNEAVLQTYNTKVKIDGVDKWIKKVTYLPMIRGIVMRVERSGKIKPFYAEVVYKGEAFSIDMSKGDRRPVHEYDPFNRGEEDDIIGAYSVARYTDGTVDCEPMPRAEIEKIRAVAKTKTVWDGWYVEKAKVAVMKRHSKRLPLSAEDMDFILNRDETDFDQAPPVVKKKESGFARMAEQARQEAIEGPRPDLEQHEQQEPIKEKAQTGEIIDAEAVEAASPEFIEGMEWAEDPQFTLEYCPFKKGSTGATEWLAGFEKVRSGGKP